MMLYVLEMTPVQIKMGFHLAVRFVIAWWILLTMAALFSDCYRILSGTSGEIIQALNFTWLCAWWMPRGGARRYLSLGYEQHYREQT